MPVDRETQKIQRILKILEGESDASLRRILNYVTERMRSVTDPVPVLPEHRTVPDDQFSISPEDDL